MSYAILHQHTIFSMLDGFSNPKDVAKRAKELGLYGVAVTDHGNCSGHLKHYQACKKEGIPYALGNELYVYHQPCSIKNNSNRWNSHMVVWAKNKEGWKKLLKLTSYTNHPDLYYYKPRIYPWQTKDDKGNIVLGLEDFLDGDMMGFSGHQGSHLSDILFCDLYSDDPKNEQSKLKKAYGQYKTNDQEYYKSFLKDGWLESACDLAIKFQKMFGKDNFFIELQNEFNPKDRLPLKIHPTIVECLREVSKETGIMALASSDPHYARKENAEEQRLMLMINMRETEDSVQKKLDSDDETDIMVFFGSDEFYMHSPEEMQEKFTDEELENTIRVFEQIEQYDILEQPVLPDVDVPEFNEHSSMKICQDKYDKYLMYLCIEGAKEKSPWLDTGHARKDYWDRLLMELDVIIEYRLSKYFLLMYDICNAAKGRPKDWSFDWQNNHGPIDPVAVGPGRGSASGCLISYLINITEINPLKYNLSFARFFNKGRCTKDRIELPDIDVDFSVEDREWVIGYIKNKYGIDNVAQIITFGRIQGRAAIKDIVRVKNIPDGYNVANEICKHIPDEGKVSDQIQEMREAGHEDYGIVQWALDNNESVQEKYDDKTFKIVFDEAMKLEGVIRNKGKHASGVVVTPKDIDEYFPMSFDTRSKEKLVGFDMKDSAKCGAVKLDILGTTILDKLKYGEKLVNQNECTKSV